MAKGVTPMLKVQSLKALHYTLQLNVGFFNCYASIVIQMLRTRRVITPLHIAARRNKTVAISELLAHQHCNPNVQNNVGDTPLHSIIKTDVSLHNALVKNRQKKTVAFSQLLVHHQCDPNVKNMEGDTALHIAVNNTSHMISQLLVNVIQMFRTRMVVHHYTLHVIRKI